MAQIAKIPYILITTAGLHVAFTAPAPLSPKFKQSESATSNKATLSWIIGKLGVLKVLLWLAAIIEIAAIASQQTPESSFARIAVSKGLGRGADAAYRLTPFSTIGMALVGGGALLRIICYRALTAFHTFEISIVDGHKLITTGPYSVVRHPSYTGLIALYFGMNLWFLSPRSLPDGMGALDTLVGKIVLGLFITAFWKAFLGILERLPEEDALLRGTFGKEWEEWARKVPYSLIPGIY
ncbi:hypothetical protein D9615_007172 [Tricholomella constricta]|uniref:Protein-S-isoprenylcysteine O-methyltransferase n=1 Tax=Tricholomella constricta TaxID=117010 RepID=A0A8H5M2M2_9AGAR|nr:hypothetical protein D9615_007172 [Tricholomella constricta]